MTCNHKQCDTGDGGEKRHTILLHTKLKLIKHSGNGETPSETGQTMNMDWSATEMIIKKNWPEC